MGGTRSGYMMIEDQTVSCAPHSGRELFIQAPLFVDCLLNSKFSLKTRSQDDQM